MIKVKTTFKLTESQSKQWQLGKTVPFPIRNIQFQVFQLHWR